MSNVSRVTYDHVEQARRTGNSLVLSASARRAAERRKEKGHREWSKRLARLQFWVQDRNNYVLECLTRDRQAHLDICPID